MARKSHRQGGASRAPKRQFAPVYDAPQYGTKSEYRRLTLRDVRTGRRVFKSDVLSGAPRPHYLTRKLYGRGGRRRRVSQSGLPRFGVPDPLAPLGQAIFEVAREIDFTRPVLNVVKCVQRKIRKQVLFAKQVAGRSGGSPGPYRRNRDDEVKC